MVGKDRHIHKKLNYSELGIIREDQIKKKGRINTKKGVSDRLLESWGSLQREIISELSFAASGKGRGNPY